jgi:hypothetical protein
MRKCVSLPNMRNFPKVGFWSFEDEPDLPDPREYVDTKWDRDELTRVVAYLDAAYFTDYVYFGYSTCRFCGLTNGTHDLTDGTFIFPEGFVHYLRDHSVRPADEFLEHIRNLDYQMSDLSEFVCSESPEHPLGYIPFSGTNPRVPAPPPRALGARALQGNAPNMRSTARKSSWWRFWR